jgi:hypothetical protein
MPLSLLSGGLLELTNFRAQRSSICLRFLTHRFNIARARAICRLRLQP